MNDQMMNRFKWGNMNDPRVYIDENNQRMMMNIRNNFNRLAESLIAEGKKDSAIKVLDHNLELIPHSVVPYNYFSQEIASNYFAAGAKEKGKHILTEIFSNYQKELDYYLALNPKFLVSVDEEIQRILYFMREMSMIAVKYGETEMAKEMTDAFNNYLKKYSPEN
jgi:hypothetical protein